MRAWMGLAVLLAACGSDAVAPGGDLSASADLAVGRDLAMAPVCVSDLSNIGVGDFQISFSIRTTQFSSFAIANQRSVCGAGDFWDVRVQSTNLTIETDALTDGAPNDVELVGCAKLNDGQPHQVVIQRSGGMLADWVDGVLDGGPVPSTASFGALPALVTKTDVCVGVDGTQTFDASVGTITNFCITRALATEQSDGGPPTCI